MASMPVPRRGTPGSAHLIHRQSTLGKPWGPSDLNRAFIVVSIWTTCLRITGLLVQMQIPGSSQTHQTEVPGNGVQPCVRSPSFQSDSATSPYLRITVWSQIKEGMSSGRLELDLEGQTKRDYTLHSSQKEWQDSFRTQWSVSSDDGVLAT